MANPLSDPFEHSRRKYPKSDVLITSMVRQWQDVAAELRRHPPVQIPPMIQAQTELCIAMCATPTTISRKFGGEYQNSRSEPGMAWLTPEKLFVEESRSDGPIEFLHLQLPSTRFERLAEVFGGAPILASALGYIPGIRDPLIHQIGVQILGEIKLQTAGGRVLIESLSLSLTARLVQAYATTEGKGPNLVVTPHGLDDVRLARVLDYMSTNLEEDIGIEDMASIACLSAFHFARMFRVSMGVPPHRYLSSLRFDRARTLLAQTNTSLAEIALATCFSSQGNFTRAFRAATGITPGQYRRMAR